MLCNVLLRDYIKLDVCKCKKVDIHMHNLSRMPFNLCIFYHSYSALMESLITPLQDKIEDWKKTANQLDKDHAKGRFGLPNCVCCNMFATFCA